MRMKRINTSQFSFPQYHTYTQYISTLGMRLNPTKHIAAGEVESLVSEVYAGLCCVWIQTEIEAN